MKEIFKIRRTVNDIGRKLEQLCDNHVSISRAFDLLATRSKTIEEMVVIEVMREVYQEYVEDRTMNEIYADSKTRSARMPAMALSR
ncbi:MAG TPA: hypothetical protein VF678_06040 [bacterium]